MAGDHRHDFQMFASIYFAEQREKGKGADISKLGELTPAALLEERKMTVQAIDEHERLLANHRAAIAEGKPSPLGEEVDSTFAVLDGLRAELVAVEADLAALASKGGS